MDIERIDSRREESGEVGVSAMLTKDSKEAAAAMFREIDKNKSELLSHGEIKSYMKASLWAESLLQSKDFHWKDLFDKYDSDEDGDITQVDTHSRHTLLHAFLHLRTL